MPAELAGFERKGKIVPGYDADLAIFDPQRELVLSAELLHEQVDWTPYEGMALHGWPETTISRGEIIVEDGQFIGQAGRGRFVRRNFD